MATVSWAHLALYPALNHESPMRTDNLEFQKARSVLARIAAQQIDHGHRRFFDHDRFFVSGFGFYGYPWWWDWGYPYPYYPYYPYPYYPY